MAKKEYQQIRIEDFDALYHASQNKYILNNRTLMSKNLAKEIIAKIYEDGTADISQIPICECGRLKGERYRDHLCTSCNSSVRTNFVEKLSHDAWLHIEDYLPKVPNHAFFLILKGATKSQKSSYIEQILNPDEKMTPALADYLMDPTTGEVGRGFRYFYENFDHIMDVFINHFPNTAKKPGMAKIAEFIRVYRDRLFCRYLPILSSALHVTSSKGNQLFIDDASEYIVKAAIDLSCMAFRAQDTVTNKKKYINETLWRVYSSYIDYIRIIIDKRIGKKEGTVKHHGFGSRCYWTGRAVVIPITKIHDLDEIHIPWKVAVGCHKLEIINYLVHKYGRTINDACLQYRRACIEFDKTVYDILLTLKKDWGPYKGIPVIWGRNPTLAYGSMMLLFSTVIKTDPHDETMAIPVGLVERPNADFDICEIVS